MIELVSPSPEVIEEKVKSKESFLIVGISGKKEIMKYCNLIASIIESNSMSCRVITKGRTIIGLPFVFTPPGWVYFGAQVCHNILTLYPDWKIIRNLFTNKIKVSFCGTK